LQNPEVSPRLLDPAGVCNHHKRLTRRQVTCCFPMDVRRKSLENVEKAIKKIRFQREI
jgi:hypothetical protein